MNDVNDLVLYAHVVEAGGFSAAERRTGMPKSRSSRRVAALERTLGVRLIQRSAHRFEVTEIGERVYRHARSLVDAMSAVRATVDAAQREPSGLVRMSAAPLTGELLLGGWLADFGIAYPQVNVVLALTNRYVDLVAERIDLALRYANAPLASSDVIARPLGRSRMVVVASPALLARMGEPADVAALDAWPVLALGDGSRVRAWTFRDDDGHAFAFHPRPRFATEHYLALREAALRGLGAIQLPLEACHDAVRTGALRLLLERFEPLPATAYAVYPTRVGVPTAVRMLVDFLAARFDDHAHALTLHERNAALSAA